jgi:hypothetical protein
MRLAHLFILRGRIIHHHIVPKTVAIAGKQVAANTADCNTVIGLI